MVAGLLAVGLDVDPDSSILLAQVAPSHGSTQSEGSPWIQS